MFKQQSPCFSLQGSVPPVQFMTYSRAHIKHSGLGITTHMHSSFLSRQSISVQDSHPSKPGFSQRPFMSCIHRSLMSAFLVNRSHMGIYKHHAEQRVTVQIKDTHTPDVRPVDDTQSRQIYLYRYLPVYKYKIMTRRLLNYAYSCEVILFLSFVFIHVKDL